MVARKCFQKTRYLMQIDISCVLSHCQNYFLSFNKQSERARALKGNIITITRQYKLRSEQHSPNNNTYNSVRYFPAEQDLNISRYIGKQKIQIGLFTLAAFTEIRIDV